MYVTTTEKSSVTIDKGQKLGHFCKIKKIPLGHNSEIPRIEYVQENPDVW
jgi:hypothetical protein